MLLWTLGICSQISGMYLKITLLGHIVSPFNLLRIRLFSRIDASFYIPTSSIWGSNFSIPVIVYLLIINILVLVKKFNIVFLIYIFLMTNGIDHHFICSLVICIFSMKKFLFKFIIINHLSFYYWVVIIFYIISMPVPNLIYEMQISLQFLKLSLYFLIVSFEEQSIFIFIKSNS